MYCISDLWQEKQNVAFNTRTVRADYTASKFALSTNTSSKEISQYITYNFFFMTNLRFQLWITGINKWRMLIIPAKQAQNQIKNQSKQNYTKEDGLWLQYLCFKFC